ncbi:MAG: hypothetical protein PHC61_15425 [Chitinivibrionales bacterium]|nr:hypothetical protein [Chitinivibrionales bacterium]
MKKGLRVLCLAAMLGFAAVISASRAAIVAPLYPQYRLSPASPTTADSVSFWLVKGKSNQTCYPRYATTFRIAAASGVAASFIIIKYQALVLGIACIAQADSVEYGPQFKFGKLPAGSYSILDSASGAIVKSFTVATAVNPGKDTVTCTPLTPTINDSLDFSLFVANLGCGGTVHYDTVLVADTNIYLSFSYEACAACDCISLGQWIPFHSKPLMAGTYSINKLQIYYCPPGMLCPAIAFLPERVGQVTVQSATAVVLSALKTVNRASVSFERSSKLLTLSLPSAQSITLEIFGLNGRKIAAVLADKKLSAGTYSFALDKFTHAHGCLVARLVSDAGEKTAPLMLTK